MEITTVFIVRETEYGNIDSVWLSEERASKRSSELSSLWKALKSHTRRATWIAETWEIEDTKEAT